MDKKEIEFCVQELIKECRNLKIPVSRKIDSEITINKRARSRFAACRREKGIKGEIYRIEIGEMLLVTDKKVVRTILAHELLHTCRGCYNHGTKWKEYASKMNQTYGYKIKTTATYEELGLEALEREKKINYVITCQKCGKTFYRQKRSKLITNINQYRCRCGGRLNCEKQI